MTPVETWAAGAAFVAGSAIAVRARMLRPKLKTWTAAPWPVWGGLWALAVALLMTAVAIGSGGGASAREAMVYTVLGLVSLIMLWNLNRHGRADEARRRAVEKGVRQVMDLSGPPARYPWEVGNG